MDIIGASTDYIELLEEEPLQLSNRPLQPKPKPKQKLIPVPTVRDVLFATIQDKQEAAECIAWAEQQFVLQASRSPEENTKEVQYILRRWETVKEQRLKWSILPTPIPTLSKYPITVADLHTYLSEILAIHPLVATMPVYHEECRGATVTYEVIFEEETGAIVLH
jgi:hypothetical protein